MQILAVALFVVAMAAPTTADDEVSIENPAPEDMVPEIPLNETTKQDGFPQSDVSILNPALEGRVPEIPLNETTQTRGFLQPPVRQKRQTQDDTNLKWKTWRGWGSVPRGAVRIYNHNRRRTDWVCKSGCDAGFYTPSKGPYCYNPFGGREFRARLFEILVNEGNLENLVWKGGSYGRLPQNSVQTCSLFGIYVGKNKDGLGKVHARHEAFYLPWNGKEIRYRQYDVLTYDTDILSQRITNVRYNTKQAKIVNYPPETLSKSTTTNHACRTVTKTVSLQKKQQVEKRWDTSSSITLGVSTSITAGIPSVASVGIEFSAEITKQFSQGTTVVDTKTYTQSVEVTVPPNRSCVVLMLGNRARADVPFTARVTRRYRNGVTRSAPISGTYKGVDTYDVHTVVDRCTPIPNARPCPE